MSEADPPDEIQMIDPRKHRQLFIDDFAIETETRTTRTLHSPKKWGPVITGGIQSRTCPQWNSDKNLWEWWYFGGHVYYATSEDGEHWEKGETLILTDTGKNFCDADCDLTVRIKYDGNVLMIAAVHLI